MQTSSDFATLRDEEKGEAQKTHFPKLFNHKRKVLPKYFKRPAYAQDARSNILE